MFCALPQIGARTGGGEALFYNQVFDPGKSEPRNNQVCGPDKKEPRSNQVWAIWHQLWVRVEPHHDQVCDLDKSEPANNNQLHSSDKGGQSDLNLGLGS